MRVWVTRTEPGASRMATALESEGIACFVSPVLNIAPTEQPLPGGSYDLAVFVSEHAAALAANAASVWSAGVVVGIGEPAVAALRERCQAGSRIALAANADSVLQMIDGWSAPPRRTLIAKGEGGRDVIQRHLRQAGGVVVEWNAYCRVPASPAVVPDALSAIVCSSGEGVRAAAAAWFARRGCPDVQVLVPSRRAESVALEVGFRVVHVTAGAAPETVAAAINALKDRNA